MRRFVLVLVFGLAAAALDPFSENAAVGPDGALISALAAAPSAPLAVPSTPVAAPSSSVAAPAAAIAAATSPVLTPTAYPSASAALPSGALPLDGNRILAFYGKPGAKSMGILGEYPKEEVANLLLGYAKLYADALVAKTDAQAPTLAIASGTQAANQGNPSAQPVAASMPDASTAPEISPDASPAPTTPPGPASGVIPAFYIVYGACWPGGDIGYLRDSVVREWIDYAASQGILVFLDHQIGRFGVDEAMKRLLPWLVYPNVQLALDPEWRTENPMRQIGSISADELNQAQSMMSDYLHAQGLEGDRILVVHQFTDKMIVDRGKVRADWPGVTLIHTSDGFGSPSLKRNAYAWNAKAKNMPLKGLKLFFKSEVPGAGFDDPLLTPEQVLDLVPPPELIIYQ